MLLEEASTNLLRAAAKLYHADNPHTTILSEEQAVFAHAVLQEILEKLPDLKANVKIVSPEQKPIAKKNDFFTLGFCHIPLEPSSLQNSSSPLLFSTIDSVNFLAQIKKVIKHMGALLNQESQVFQIENFVNALPIPHIDPTKDFWQKIPQTDLKEGLVLIQQMVELYGDLCLNTPPFFPSQQNTALSLLSIAHRFAIRIDQQQTGKLKDYGIWNAFLSYAEQQRFFICFEPKEQQKREELYAYFTAIGRNKKQLFDFSLLKGFFTEEKHKTIQELSLFKHVIDQDSVLKNTLTEQAKELLPKRLREIGFIGSLELVKETILITDDALLKSSDKTVHLAILRDISFIAQQFAGYIEKVKCYRSEAAVSRKYFCKETCWRRDEIEYYQLLSWGNDGNSDPAMGFHLLSSRNQVQSLVKSLDSFSQSLSVVTNQTESKLQLQPQYPSFSYHKQLETTQCEPDLQPQKLIYYFQEHLEELTDLDKQALFDLIFFKQIDHKVPLFQELKNNSLFIQQCKQFILAGLGQFSQSRSEKSDSFFAYLFFVRFMYRLNQIQQDLELPYLDLPSIQDALNGWLESPNLNVEDKACLHLHRMMQYAHLPNDKISLQQLREIIPSWFYYKRSHLLAKQMPYLENQATTFIHRLAPCLENLMLAEQQTIICQILEVIGIASIQPETIQEASLQPPLYKITFKNKNFWKLHLLNAQIENEKGLVASASTKELQKRKNYQDLFKDKIFDIYKSGGYYCFFCPERGQIRIHEQMDANDCNVEASIHGDWYQYVPESALIGTKLPCALIQGHWHWHSMQKKEMLIISKEDNQIVAKIGTIESVQYFNGFYLLQIENLQKEQILYPTDPLESFLEEINKIESPHWRLIFQGENTTRVCFPRLHSIQGEELQFVVEKSSQKAQLIQDKRFTIAKHIPGLIGHLDDYLILEDLERKKKKVLIPVQEIEQNNDFSPERICLNLEPENKGLQLTYLEFELNQAKISTRNEEGILFLAYLYLAQRDYIKALEYLSQIVKADVLSEIASTILTKFLNLPKLNQDKHPSGIAIRLKALFLLQSKSNWKVSEKEDLAEDYFIYKARIVNVDRRFLLTSEEEQYYSSFIPSLSVSDFLSEWEEIAKSVFHQNCPLIDLGDIGRVTTELILKNFESYKELYEQARSAKTEAEKLLISTQLYFMDNNDVQFFTNVRVFAMIHFALKFPELAPTFPERSKEEWLKKIVEKYREQYEMGSSLRSRFPSNLEVRSSAKDPIFHVHDPRILGRLHKLCLPTSQVEIRQVLTLPPVEPENRCFALSKFADAYFTQVPTSIERVPLDLKRLEKEDCQQAIETEYEDFLKDLEEGILVNQATTEFSLKESSIQELSNLLKKFLDHQSLEIQKQKILQLANSTPPNYALQNNFLEKGGLKSRVDVKQLICAFLKGDANDYYQLNFYLSVQEIQELDCLLQQFMLESTKQCQVQRALTLLENMQKMWAKDAASMNQELHAVLTEKMAYDPAQNRILLVYEYQARIRVRQNQMKLLSAMTADLHTSKSRNLITQLIMGGGKTSVLASILLATLAKPPKLAVFIPPSAQFDTLRNNLKKTQHAYFLQQLIPIQLTRSEFSKEKLEEVYQKLKQAQAQGSVVLIQKETVQSFALELQSMLYKEAISKAPLQELGAFYEKVTILRNIIQLFRSSGYALLDECDLQLDPMQEVNFTVGEKKQIDPVYIACGAEIFNILVSDQLKTVNQKQSLAECVGLLHNAQSFMKTEDYYTQVLPVLAKELLTSYRDTLLLTEEPEAPFLNYVQGKLESSKLTAQEDHFLLLLKSYASSLDDLEREAAALIAWIKMQFTEILPLTLSKDTNRHYGRSTTQEIGRVVPYQGVNSPATTQFGSPWEALAYQFQTALSKKLDVELVRAYVQKVYREAEFISFHTQMPMESTQEAKKFLELTAISLSQAKEENPLKTIVETINKDPSKILEVESEVAAHFISHYPSYLNSNASHFFEQFKAVIGFSGTPWNSSCYPGDLAKNVLFDLGTEGRIVDVACRKARQNPNVIHLIQNTNVQEVLKSCLQKNPRKNQVMAFIDVAGVFKDYSNLYTAEQILAYFKEDPRIEHILFFGRINPQESAPNTLMALKKDNPLPVIIGSTRVQELEKHGIDPKSTFIYYDERHSEATDLPQIPDAVNLLSSNGSMILRDLLQGMLRARKYLEKQDIEYVLHENTIKQLGIQGKPSFENAVLNPSIANQAQRKAKETYRSFLHKIDQVLFKCAWEHVLDQQTPQEMIPLFKQYRTLFLHSSEVDCFKQYGHLLQKGFGLQVLEKYAQDRFQYWEQIQSDAFLREQVKNNLEQVLKNAATCKFLPNLVTVKPSTLGLEQQVQIIQQEIQKEVEQEVDVELQKELESYQHNDRLEPRTESIWSFDDIASKSFLKIAKISPLNETAHSVPKTYLLLDFLQNYLYLKPYYKIFEEQRIIITENAMYTSGVLCSVFSNTQKPAHQILIVKEQEEVHAILLSIQEAKTFKEYLATHNPPDMWLILPNAEKLSLPKKEETHLHLQQEIPVYAGWLARTLWFVNFLNGDMAYLITHKDLTKRIIEEKDAELKMHFLQLKTLQDPKKKTLFGCLLKNVLNDTSRTHRLESQQRHLQRRAEQKKIKSFVEGLKPEDIKELSEKDCKYVPFLDSSQIVHLKNPALIQRLSSSQIKEVIPTQVPYLLPTQVLYLEKPEQIQSVSNDQLHHLLPEQINCLTIDQVTFLPNQKMQYLKQELLVQIEPPRICWLYNENHLSQLQLKWLSEKQLVALLENEEIQEILPHLDNSQLPYITKEAQIQAIPLDFVSYLVKSQIPFLSFSQISQIADREYKHLTARQFKHKYSQNSTILMLLKGWVLWNLRILAYIGGIYLLKRISFLRFFSHITDVLDRSNIYLGIGYRMLTSK